MIIEKIHNALKNDERGQLIFVEGEAGTGKTVLNSSTFYELFCRYEEAKKKGEEYWHKPWNRELERYLSKKEKTKIKDLSWAEQPQTIKEIGSTYTIQGFELNYAGVILGPSVKYENGHIIFDPK